MTFQELVARAISEAGGITAATRALGFYSVNSLAQWRDGRTIPEPEDVERLQKLSDLIKVSLEEVTEAVRIARRARVLHKQAQLPNRSYPPRKPLADVAKRLVRSHAAALA